MAGATEARPKGGAFANLNNRRPLLALRRLRRQGGAFEPREVAGAQMASFWQEQQQEKQDDSSSWRSHLRLSGALLAVLGRKVSAGMEPALLPLAFWGGVPDALLRRKRPSPDVSG